MAEYTINNSPIHSDSTLSAVYGETGPFCDQFHTGDDFIPYGSTPAHPDIYSVSSGTVVETSNSTSLWHGNMVLIYDSTTGYYWRYCHMVAGSITVSVGQTVTTGTKLRSNGSYWKCYRNTPSFRSCYYSNMAIFNIFKSFYNPRNCKC